jgi:hypothetical protein
MNAMRDLFLLSSSNICSKSEISIIESNQGKVNTQRLVEIKVHVLGKKWSFPARKVRNSKVNS